MRKYDVVVIGGGVLGCFAARNLRRFKISTAVLEKSDDVCTGISKANTAVIYGSQDNKPGTVKARLCKQSNDNFAMLCDELGVEFHRCGSLMVCFGERGLYKLQRGLERGQANGVENLRIIDREEILTLEPNLSPNVYKALYAPSTGTVSPWELTIAAAENAAENGAEFYLNTEVTAIKEQSGEFLITTNGESFCAKAVINATGLSGDKVNFMAGVLDMSIVPTRADYLVLDEQLKNYVNHIIFYEPEEKKAKGITAVPTVDGNIMLGPSEMKMGDAVEFETTADGIDFVENNAKKVLPGIDLCKTIRTFASMRPNPFWNEIVDGNVVISDESIRDFPIFWKGEKRNYLSLAGIKTPGLTCANALGMMITRNIAEFLLAEGNEEFNPHRLKAVHFRDLDEAEQKCLIAENPAWGNIVCLCNQVTEAELVKALHSPLAPKTLDGLKRRTGCTLGRCQGSRCTDRILEIMARELQMPIGEIMKDGDGSWIAKNMT